MSVPHLRVILDTLCNQFGSDDPLPWLARLKLEVAAGKALEAAKIVCRCWNPLTKRKFALHPNFRLPHFQENIVSRAETALSSGDLRQKFALLRDKEGV